LYTESYIGTEGEWRLDEALQSIKENMNENDQRIVIEYTLDIASHFNIEGKDSISEVIIKYFPESVKDIFNRIEDRYSLSMLLEEPANKLTRIMEGM
jgi:hypothetical protein